MKLIEYLDIVGGEDIWDNTFDVGGYMSYDDTEGSDPYYKFTTFVYSNVDMVRRGHGDWNADFTGFVEKNWDKLEDFIYGHVNMEYRDDEDSVYTFLSGSLIPAIHGDAGNRYFNDFIEALS